MNIKKDIFDNDINVGDVVVYSKFSDLCMGQILKFTENSIKISVYRKFIPYHGTFPTYKGWWYIQNNERNLNNHNSFKYISNGCSLIKLNNIQSIDFSNLKSLKQLQKEI